MAGQLTHAADPAPIGFAPQKENLIRALNLVLICLLIGFSYHESSVFPFTPVAILGLIFVRDRASFVSYMIFASLLGLLFFPHYEEVYLRIKMGLVVESALGARSLSYTPLEMIGTRLLCVCLCLGLFRMLWKYLMYPLRMLLFFGALLIAFMWAARSSLAGSPPGPLIWCVLTAILARTFLSAMLLRCCDPRQEFSWSRMVFVYPFFQYDLAIWDQSRVLRPAAEIVDQWRYLRRICPLVLVLAISRFLKWLFFQSPEHRFTDLHAWGYLRLISGHSSLAEGWVNFLFHPLYYAATILCVYRNSICIMFGVLGYPMSNDFDEPWKAKSFSDFIARMFHYYSRFVTNLLFIPLMQKTRFLRRIRPFDQLIVLFFSIFLFSMLYHLSREYWISFGPRLAMTFIYLKDYTFYSAVLAFSVCLSLAVERADRWRRLGPGFRLPIYFLVYAIIWHFGAFQNDSLEIKWLALKTLFGGGIVN